LLRMAGIDPDSLDEILNGDPETRRQIVGRAGAGLTRRLRELWKDRPLKVRFNLDGDHFNTLVCDPASFCDIEVNLNQRSRGFRWFFSFFVMLTASRGDPAGENAVFLLDEPGLHLHANGQRDLLRHLAEHVGNQAIIATQSPFMVPTGDEAAVHVVRFDEEAGTTVSDDPSAVELGTTPSIDGAARPEVVAGVAAPAHPAATWLVPSDLVEALFGSRPVLVVEHPTDFWYVNAVSDHLAAQGRQGLPQGMVVMAAGGATWIPYMMALLGEPSATPIVLLTSRPPNQVRAALSGAGVEDPKGLVFIGAGLPAAPADPVELEDLIDPRILDRFVRLAYREQLAEKELEPNTSIACAVERYEEAFGRIGLAFSRRELARLITGKSQRNLQAALSSQAGAHFERLFKAIRREVDALTS